MTRVSFPAKFLRRCSAVRRVRSRYSIPFDEYASLNIALFIPPRRRKALARLSSCAAAGAGGGGGGGGTLFPAHDRPRDS